MAANSTGGSRLPVPVKRGNDWVVLGNTANRLWDRGCFGKPIRDGVQLTTTEVLCAHRLRGLPLPHDQWLQEALDECPDLLLESEVLDAPVSYTHLTLPTNRECRSRWSPYH